MSGLRRNRAFTIVEILTVIVIIGILVTMLVPAVNMARESARQATCINNQKEIGLAILQYELAKRQLPGFVGRMPIAGVTPTTPNVNWVISLFPFLERKDIWDAWRRGTFTPVRVDRLVCPDDGAAKAMAAPLSYVVNDIYFPNRFSSPPTDKFNEQITNEKTVSQYSSPRQIVMLAERTQGEPTNTIPPDPSTNPAPYHAGPWTAMTWWALTFNWPKPGPTVTGMPPPLAGTKAAPSTAANWPTLSPKITTSNHPGISVVTFLDGHTDRIAVEILSSDAQFWNDPVPPP